MITQLSDDKKLLRGTECYYLYLTSASALRHRSILLKIHSKVVLVANISLAKRGGWLKEPSGNHITTFILTLLG